MRLLVSFVANASKKFGAIAEKFFKGKMIVCLLAVCQRLCYSFCLWNRICFLCVSWVWLCPIIPKSASQPSAICFLFVEEEAPVQPSPASLLSVQLPLQPSFNASNNSFTLVFSIFSDGHPMVFTKPYFYVSGTILSYINICLLWGQLSWGQLGWHHIIMKWKSIQRMNVRSIFGPTLYKIT